MNDDIESRLRRATPLGAPPSLRARALAAVDGELKVSRRRRPPPWMLVAAAVLAGLTLNYGANRSLDRRLSAVLGPTPQHRLASEIADDVATITDPATGRWAYQRLAPVSSRDDGARQYAVRLRALIRQLTLEPRDNVDETPPKDPQMGRDLRRSRDRPPADAQCALRLAQRDSA